MVKIFRNIRQKLAAENKVMAYFRYAVGEILLIVIGILIALQINNWNEARKNKIEERTSLKQIKEDLLAEVALLKGFNVYSKEELHYLNEISNGNYNHVSIDSFFIKVASTLDFKSITIETKYYGLKSSGKLDLISNDSLKNKIMLFYENTHSFLETNINYNKEFVLKNIEAPLVDILPLNKNLIVTDTNKTIDLLKSSNIISKVNYQIFYYKRFEDTALQIIKIIHGLIADIDKELNSN